MIKGAVNFLIGPVSIAQGRAKFPISHHFTDKRVCAASVLLFTNLDTNYRGISNKYQETDYSIYINLFDVYGQHFVKDLNAYYCSFTNWGRVNQFQPRFIDASKSYLKFNGLDDSVREFSLLICFS